MKDKMQPIAQTMVGDVDAGVLAFTVGRDPILDRELVEWDCIGTAAHVNMLANMTISPPVLSVEDRDAVIRELIEIMRAARDGRFAITLADQDVHLAVERRLTEKLGDLGQRVHTGRSRNDQVAVDLRLFLRERMQGLTDDVLDLCEGLLTLAEHHRDVPMVGRTHLQPAMPSSVGLWTSGYAEALLDDLLICRAAETYADRCPLGSAAGYGVPLPIDRKLTARLLGFSAPHHNVFYAGMARGKAECLALDSAVHIMLTLSRWSEDLILFSMPEFGYFTLPKTFCTGSSIMPQKRNPDVLELVRAKTARVLGHNVSAAVVLKGLAGGYNRDLQEIKEPFMDGLETTRDSTRILARMCPHIEVHADRLRAGFSPGVFATDIALRRVAEGVPFREAYRQVRSELASLQTMDPDVALAQKTHEGGTAGLDLPMLRERVRRERNAVARRRAASHAAFARLLDVPYPKL